MLGPAFARAGAARGPAGAAPPAPPTTARPAEQEYRSHIIESAHTISELKTKEHRQKGKGGRANQDETQTCENE